MDTINTHNFIRWYKTYSYSTTDNELKYECFLKMQEIENENNSKAILLSAPVLAIDEITSFYINACLDIDFELDAFIIDPKTFERLDFIGLANKIKSKDGNRYYMSFTNPVMPNGIYRLGLFIFSRTKGYTLCLISTPIIYDNTNFKQYTMALKFRNSNNVLEYEYEKLPLFYQNFRVNTNCINANEPNADLHDAILGLLKHNEIYVNNIKFNTTSDLKKSLKIESNLIYKN